eukprot:UN00752
MGSVQWWLTNCHTGGYVTVDQNFSDGSTLELARLEVGDLDVTVTFDFSDGDEIAIRENGGGIGGISSVFFQCEDTTECDPIDTPTRTGLDINCRDATIFKDECIVTVQEGYSCENVQVICAGGFYHVEGECSDCRPSETESYALPGSYVDCRGALFEGDECILTPEPGFDCQHVTVEP